MTLILLFFVLFIFGVYFYEIWLWYLIFFPVIFFLSLVGFFSVDFFKKYDLKLFINKYWIVFARIIMIVWLWWIIKTLWFSVLYSSVILIVINIVLWLVSYVLNYKDWEKSWIIWTYILIWFTMFFSIYKYWFNINMLFKELMLFCSLLLWVVSFIVFILNIKKKVSLFYIYKFVWLLLWYFILLMFKYIWDIFVSLSVSGFLLLLLFIFIDKVWKKHIFLEKTIEESEKLNYILSGKKITNFEKKIKSNKIIEYLKIFFDNTPKFMKYFYNIVNVGLVFILIINYIWYFWKQMFFYQQFLFWVVIVLFISNVYFLRKIWYTSILQKIVLFLIINFVIYVNLFYIFWNDYNNIVIGWIIRNILNSFLLFYFKKKKDQTLFTKFDYIFWLVISLFVMFLNIVFLTKTTMSWDLLFPVVLLYFGLQSMVLFYVMKE